MAITSYPWKDDPIEFVMRIKFPLERAYRASSLDLRLPERAQHDRAYLKRASDYRQQLGAMARDELLALAQALALEEAHKAQAKRDAEESQRFFNEPHAALDIHYWSRMSAWTIDEATALSFGKDPRYVNWEKLKSLVQVSPFAKAYREQQELFNRARLAGQLWESTLPGIFLAWADRMKVEMPAGLVVAVKDLGIQIADWKSLHDRLQTRVQELEAALAKQPAAPPSAPSIAIPSKAKGFSSRERNSLLTLVIGMATAWYGYDASKTRNSTAKEISDDLLRVGLSLSDDTIRGYLQEARDLLPPPETE